MQDDASASKRLLRNSALMVLSRTVAMISVLATVPVLWRHLGADGYGTLEALLALTAMLMILQSSVSGTILWQASACYGVSDVEGTRRAVQLGITVSFMSAAILVPLIHVFNDPLLGALQFADQPLAVSNWLLPAAVSVTLLGGINQSLLSVVSGYQQSGAASLVQSLGLVVSNVTMMACAARGCGFESVVYGASAGFLVTLVLAGFLAFRCCPCLSLLPTVPSIVEVRRFAPYAGLLLLSSLSVVFREQLDKLLLTTLTSAKVTAHFGIAHRLSGVVMQVCTVMFVPMTAAFAASHAAGNWASLQSNFLKWSKWMAMLAGIATVTIITLRSSLLVLWLGVDQPDAHGFIGIMILATGTAVIFSGSGVALAKGVGMPGLETRYAMLTLLLVLILKPLLCLGLGPSYAVAASAISWTMGAVCFLWLLYRRFELPVAGWTNTVTDWTLTLVVSGIGWWLGGMPWMRPADRLGAALMVLSVAPIIGLIFFLASGGIRHHRERKSDRREINIVKPHFHCPTRNENATSQVPV